MENRFCGKCGQPLGTCSCDTTDIRHYASAGTQAARQNGAGTEPNFVVNQFDNLALGQGEVAVRQYHIGRYGWFKRLFGRGNSYVLITNKRVIHKTDASCLGTNTNTVEEINIDCVNGVRNMRKRKLSFLRILLGLLLIYCGIVMFFQLGDFFDVLENVMYDLFDWDLSLIVPGLFFMILGVLQIVPRKPSYLFHVYAYNSAPALLSGVNLRGKTFGLTGIVFPFKATKESIVMMREIGACILDIRNKGEAAVKAWKNI
ncbi:MAG: hypothetical protein E7331_08830 [Clostridiales bacterium]|nr:hypothetical protein [Clostridiales bacterium]